MSTKDQIAGDAARLTPDAGDRYLDHLEAGALPGSLLARVVAEVKKDRGAARHRAQVEFLRAEIEREASA